MDNKKFEELTITDDFMFGIIMRNPKYCKPFLETVLNIRIRHIEYPEDQKTIFTNGRVITRVRLTWINWIKV